MGQGAHYLNISSFRYVIQSNGDTIENILRLIEGRSPIQKLLPKSNVRQANTTVTNTVVEVRAIDGQEFEETDKENKEENGSEHEKKKEEDEEVVNQRVTVNGIVFEYLYNEQITDTTPIDIHALIAPYGKTLSSEKYDDTGYMVTMAQLLSILQQLRVHDYDQDILQNIFCLTDKRGYDLVDIRDILISFTVIVAKDISDCINTTFRIYDRSETSVVSKEQLNHIFVVMNESLFNFGDRCLNSNIVVDLADSIFTVAGKIDGDICYPDYLTSMTHHPILAMLLSQQFQGPARDKYLDDQSLTEAELTVM